MHLSRPAAVAAHLVLLACFVCNVQAQQPPAEPATFFAGVNLGGPAVTIDGNQWHGDDWPGLKTGDKTIDKQDAVLVPETDPERAKMIRSSRWGDGADIKLVDVPAGLYTVYYYLWEDNDSETFDLMLNGRRVLNNFESGTAGQWHKLGPFEVTSDNGMIRLMSRGGAANISGIEVWRGQHGLLAAHHSAEGVDFFEKRIRPLLTQHCQSCHGSEAEEVADGLLLDSRMGWMQGGHSSPAILPGNLEQSLVIKAVRYNDADLQMPPDGKLSDQEIADLETWVKMGAPDPRLTAVVPATAKKGIDFEAARQFWSLKPIERPAVPNVKDSAWPLTDIDRFVLAELERQSLAPVAEADKRALIRRATFDLTGLPPTPDEVQQFLADESPEAFQRVVDRLLGSPAYGERWGRHWMDLVRYADTAGDNSDYPVPQLFRYRNYVIDSFNRDKPFDQFVKEQLAGDLLPADNDEVRNEHTIATGYIALSRRFGSVLRNYPQHLTIEDTIDNLGRTFLGLSIGCARCHDHKFDPISQEDYYALYGIFESTRYPFPGLELDKKPREFVPLAGKDGEPDTLRLAYAVADGKIGDARVQRRGEPKKQGESVPRRFLEVLGGQTLTEEQAKSSGRLQLAEWITSSSNPLTPRVLANRLWHYHFGRGLVKTASDFGVRGTAPSNPALLDYLASRLMEEGWSIKKMHREIMLSRTYQLGTFDNPDNRGRDPENVYYWRFNRRRLDAESLRDSLMTLAGTLDRAMPNEPHPFPPAEKWGFTQHKPFKDTYDSNHRSVYLMTARLNALPFFAKFDGADRNASTALRDSSVTTLQALYLLNDDFVHGQANKLSERLAAERPSVEAQVQYAFELVLNRSPGADELAGATSYIEQLSSQASGDESARRNALASFTRVLLRTNEFLYVE